MPDFTAYDHPVLAVACPAWPRAGLRSSSAVSKLCNTDDLKTCPCGVDLPSAHVTLTPAERETAYRSPLLAGFPEASGAKLLEGARLQDARAGQIIFQQGALSEALFIVLEGWIKLYRMAPSGVEAVVTTLSDGQSFGEAAALCGQPYLMSAEAIAPARLLRLDAGHLRRLLHSEPVLATSILVPAFGHLEKLVMHIEELKAHTGVQRVAEFLLTLAMECEGGCSIALPYSKALIAGQLGIKPETLSRAFARLRGYGVQADAAVVRIEDIARLRDLMAEEGREAASSAGPRPGSRPEIAGAGREI